MTGAPWSGFASIDLSAILECGAGLLFGFDTGVISGAILFIKGEFGLTPFAEELLVSAALIGAVCGSILSGRLTDLIGRKRAILITAGIFTVGSLLCAIATSTGVLIEGRIAIGVAIGVASYTAPLYIGEMAPPKLRGGLVTLNQLAITVGILVAYIIDAAFASSGNWRLMFGFGVFPALALGLGIAVLPSPRDLLVEVRAISVNPVDAKIRAGSGPGKLQGELSILGWDAVGVVREVGTEVTLFKPGDESTVRLVALDPTLNSNALTKGLSAQSREAWILLRPLRCRLLRSRMGISI
jgi:MFS family permease